MSGHLYYIVVNIFYKSGHLYYIAVNIFYMSGHLYYTAVIIFTCYIFDVILIVIYFNITVALMLIYCYVVVYTFFVRY